MATQDALLLDLGVPLGLAAAMPRLNRREPEAVKARHQLSHSVATPTASGSCCVGEAATIGDSEQGLGAGNMGGGFGVRSADVL
ncbi:MAG: hypothetical protein ACR2JC_07175 [Chloroflexota bacterium]